jgi:aryl-alcohol dehydrogenase-like predicted oxidoreductase
LGTDYIDLYQIHYRDGNTPLEEVVSVLQTLQTQGKIRFYGICNAKAEALPELLSCGGLFASIQNQYSLAFRDKEADFRKLTETLDATPLTWGSLGQGILTGKYTSHTVFGSDDRRSRPIYSNFHGNKLNHNLRIVDVLKQIAAQQGKPVSAVALRFILDHLPESVVLCGIKRPDQLHDNVQAFSWHLSGESLQALDNISRENT